MSSDTGQPPIRRRVSNLLIAHHVTYYQALMAEIRTAIEEDRMAAFARAFAAVEGVP